MPCSNIINFWRYDYENKNQEIEAMNLEYSTIFIQAELEKGKENINAMKKSATMSAEVNATKQRMQEFILSQEELEEIKQNNYSYMDDTVQLLYYLGKTSKGTQAFLFNTVRLSADLPITTIESYTFYFPKRDIVVLHDGMTIILTAAYAYEIIDAQELDEIYEKYVIIASNDPLYGDFIKD